MDGIFSSTYGVHSTCCPLRNTVNTVGSSTRLPLNMYRCWMSSSPRRHTWPSSATVFPSITRQYTSLLQCLTDGFTYRYQQDSMHMFGHFVKQSKWLVFERMPSIRRSRRQGINAVFWNSSQKGSHHVGRNEISDIFQFRFGSFAKGNARHFSLSIKGGPTTIS